MESDDQLTGVPIPTESLDLSEFATKLLEQLSVTSWLPAAVLTANGALLAAFWRADSVDPASVARQLERATGVTVTALLLTLVFLTMMTQAFELGACRFLQGRSRLYGPIGLLLTRRQEWRLARLRRQRHQLIVLC